MMNDVYLLNFNSFSLEILDDIVYKYVGNSGRTKGEGVSIGAIDSNKHILL